MPTVLPFPAPVGRPLLPAASHAAPYPLDYLGPLRGVVEAATRLTQAPAAISAQTALAVASLAVQPFANVETLGGYRPVSLYLLTIARSGERKSTVDRSLAGDLDASGRTVSEPTIDGLFTAFASRPSLGLLSDEAGAFLGGYAMRPGQSQRSLAVLNNLWDGKRISLARKKGETSLAGRRLAMHLMVQPAVAQKLLADPLAESIGYLPRVLMAEPESKIGTRTISITPTPEPSLDIHQQIVADLLAKEMPINDPELMELTPRRLPLSDEAREKLIEMANEVEAAQGPVGPYEEIAPFASKAAEQACRIAAVLTLWQGQDAEEVSAEDMACGIGLATYYLDEAKRLMGRASADQDLADADELRLWLLSRPRKEFVAGDVQQRGPKRLRSRALIQRLLLILEDHGWIRRLPDGAMIDGQPRKNPWTLC